MSAWFMLFFSRCISSDWAWPADFWSAQSCFGYSCYWSHWYWRQMTLIVNREFIHKIADFTIHCPPQMLIKSGPSIILFWNVAIIKAYHGFFFFKKLSSNPMATQYCHEPLVWNLIKDIFDSNVCRIHLIPFFLIITENIPEIQKLCNFF